MPTYSYRAVNEDGKEVQGSLDAPDTITAKAVIEDLHLELIDLTEAMRLKKPLPPVDGGMTTFMFEGKDAGGSLHRGSVQAFTKREAFDNLQKSQGIQLSVLSPVGSLATKFDQDLVSWQSPTVIAQAPAKNVSSQPSTSVPTVIDPPVFVTIPEEKKSTATTSSVPEKKLEGAVEAKYASVFSTLCLYAGWLLAWYGLFIACGYYSVQRQLPFDIPAAEGFFYSPLIISFILAIFLYLVLHSIHRALSGKLMLGGVLSVVGIVLFVFLRTSLV